MRSHNPVQTTVIACAAMAIAALALASLLGHLRPGLALSAGILIGSVNGFFAERALSSSLSFRATSTARLAVLTAAGLGVGLLVGADVFWWSLVGIAAAQLVLATVAGYTLVRR